MLKQKSPSQENHSSMNTSNEKVESFFDRIIVLKDFMFGRLNSSFKNKSFQEFSEGVKLSVAYIGQAFSIKEKLVCVLTLFFIASFSLLSFELLTHNQIDEAIKDHKFAKANKLIQGRLKFFPRSSGLNLRLAHTKLAQGQTKEAKELVEKYQALSPNDSYLPTVGLVLSQTFQRQGKSYEAIGIMEKMPIKSCPECIKELLLLYDAEGKKSLIDKNFERASHYMSQELKLAQTLELPELELKSKKQDLVRAYNLYALKLLKDGNKEKAISVFEDAVKVSSSKPQASQAYKSLGKLYSELEPSSSETIRSALQAYKNAYEGGLSEIEDDHSALLVRYETQLKKENVSDNEINKRLNAEKLEKIAPEEVVEESNISISENPTSKEENAQIKWGEEKSQEKSLPVEKKQYKPIYKPSPKVKNQKSSVFQSPY
ncbi:MAG TPA: hypothetical protein V6C96_04575 [Vampirovibrionales bacterium]